MKFLYIYEFANRITDKNPKDSLWNIVRDNLIGEWAKNKVEFNCSRGIVLRYAGNGYTFYRILNFLFMHLTAPFVMIFGRPEFVLVRTTPPLIQITYLLLGKLVGAKTYVWLMDYHPLFGLRSTKKNSLIHKIWKILDKLDKFSLKFAKCVICLDEAMEELINERAPNVKTFICPTFTLEKVERLNLAQKRNHVDSLSFLYSGNLGRAHDTEDLKRLLGLLSEKVHVVLSYCGNSESSIKRFRELCKSTNVEFKAFPRVENYRDLGKFYKEQKFDYGIVILDKRMAGIVSPSKFSGYTSFGLPIIYIGPAGSNAEAVCTKFEAGIAIADKYDIAKAVEKLLLTETQYIAAVNTEKTSEYFGSGAVKRLCDFFASELNIK